MRFLNAALLLPLLALAGSAQTQQQEPVATQPEKTVCVLGAVTTPSRIPFIKGLTVTQAVREAGGVRAGSKSRYVRIYSQTTEDIIRVIPIDLRAVQKAPYLDMPLQSFDIVEVLFDKPPQEVLKNPCFARPLKTIH